MQPTEAETDEAKPRSRPGLAAAAAVAALGVFWFAASAHLERACTVMDTPYLPLCPPAPADAAGVREQLRGRIASNPGDAWAWTKLLVTGGGPPAEGLLRAATEVAPHHANVLRWRAAKAFERGDHAEGVEVLVQMVANRGSADAAAALARVATTPDGLRLLRPHLKQAQLWLPAVLTHLSALKMPPAQVLPLVGEALQAGALPETARRSYMRSLKAGGQWLDAYGLWLAHRKEMVPLLYNAGFDQPLELDGFDWEFTPVLRSRAGVVIGQATLARRGLVLDLEFTGRRFSPPILRQYVFVPPGSYRLAGEYASKLRSESGLAWTIACTSGDQLIAGHSAALMETGGAWKPFQVDFTVPRDCGPVASIQLMPTAAYEAATGMRGHFSLDAFSLTQTTQ